jgi:hypothetical protein
VNVLNSARLILGIILLISCTLFSNLSSLRGTAQTNLDFMGHDDVTLFERRLDPVKPRLSNSRMIRFALGQSNEGRRNFFLTQYVLAPIVVVESQGPKTVIYVVPNYDTEVDGLNDIGCTTYEHGDGTKILDFHNGIKIAYLPENGLQ